MDLAQHARPIIFSAPSGAGKTTIVHALLRRLPQLTFSVSVTTRHRRPHEVHGQDYYFLSLDEFHEKQANGSFVEWEEVYEGRYYGTLKSELERIVAEGKHPIFDVDVKGGLRLKKKFKAQALSLFIMPPSIEHLRLRLRQRATEDPAEIEKRMSRAEAELAFAPQFDHTIINDDLETAIAQCIQHIEAFWASAPAMPLQ